MFEVSEYVMKHFVKKVISILTGVAGSVATVLHDAVMNPAEGKKNISKNIYFFMTTNAINSID